MIPNENHYEVLILGAGLAGLSCGFELLKEKVENFAIFEARDQAFGRVCSSLDFSEIPAELGAEFVHGNNNIFFSLAKNAKKTQGFSFASDDFFEFYWVPSQRRLCEYDEIKASKPKELYKSLKKVLDFEEIIEGFPLKNQDISVQEFREKHLKNCEFSELFSALVAAENAANDQEIGLLGLREEQENWGYANDGEYREFFFKKGDFSSMFSQYFAEVLKKVRVNAAATAVNYEKSPISVTLADNSVVFCEKLVVTVSLGVLKSGKLEFSPALPEPKQLAIKELGFGGGLKIFIKFDAPLWKDGTFYIFANGQGLIPVFWVSSFEKSAKTHILTGFLTGPAANEFCFKEKELHSKVLEQLSELFAISKQKLLGKIEKITVKNWGEEPFIQGAYSFVRLGQSFKGHRKNLRENVRNLLFFAGEAASVNFPATVQGAMTTGTDAAKEILKISQGKP